MSEQDEPGVEPPQPALDPSETLAQEFGSPALRRRVAELLLDTTNEGIWLIDVQARTTFVNRHAAQLLGYAAEEMIGMHVFDLMDEARRPIAQQSLMRRQRGIEERQEVKLRRKDGTSVWVIGSANPVYDSQGRYAGALGLFGDLTAQKETEDRLRAQVEELRSRLLRTTLGRAEPSGRAAPADPVPRVSLVREAIRTAGAVAVCGTFLGTVALLAAGGVFASIRGTGGGVDPNA